MRFPKRRRNMAAAYAVVVLAWSTSWSQPQADRAQMPVVTPSQGVRLAQSPALLIGGYGRGDGQFLDMGPATLNDEGRIIIADNVLRRITWFGTNGKVTRVASFGPSGGQPVLPSADTLAYVTALAWHDRSLYIGTPQGLWVLNGTRALLVPLPGIGRLMRALEVNPAGQIYVLTDWTVKRFTTAGAFVDSIAYPVAPAPPRSQSMMLGPDGNLYVSARIWARVLVYGPDGALARSIGSRGMEPGQFGREVDGVAVDGRGNVYGYDPRAGAIKVFSADGTFAGEIGTRGSRPEQHLTCEQLLIDQQRQRLITIDDSNYRIQVYDLTGRQISTRNLVRYTAQFDPSETPDHIVLTLGDDPRTERRIAWRTDARTTGTMVDFARMGAGDDPASLDWQAMSVARATGSEQEYWSNLGPYRAHEVTLTSLDPGGQYAYRIGDGRENWSRPYAFTVTSTPKDSITAVVLGDSRNRMDVWGHIITSGAGARPAFVVSTGDLIVDGNNRDAWDQWFHRAQDVFVTVPFMPALGNHENQSPNYFLAFALPTNAPEPLREHCYSFDYGSTHWVILDTQYNMEAQASWLEHDLAATTKPWVFVVYHVPAWAAHATRGDGNEGVRRAWCDLFDRYNVAIAWQGHDHYYVRTKPIRNREIVPIGEGTVYVTTGGAGAPLYEIGPNRYTEVAEKVDHYCIMTATPSEVRVVVYRADGSLLDQFMLNNPRQVGEAGSAR